MRWGLVTFVLGGLWLGASTLSASPLQGPLSKADKIQGGEIRRLEGAFKGGERACVIVVGDHQPVVPLILRVEDEQGNLVGEDKNGGDFCAVIWYPPRDAVYRISIAVPHISGSQDYNRVYIAFK